MTAQLEILRDKIKALEIELIEELQKQEDEFSYEIRKRRVCFEKNVIIRHKGYAKRLGNSQEITPCYSCHGFTDYTEI